MAGWESKPRRSSPPSPRSSHCNTFLPLKEAVFWVERWLLSHCGLGGVLRVGTSCGGHRKIQGQMVTPEATLTVVPLQALGSEVQGFWGYALTTVSPASVCTPALEGTCNVPRVGLGPSLRASRARDQHAAPGVSSHTASGLSKCVMTGTKQIQTESGLS